MHLLWCTHPRMWAYDLQQKVVKLCVWLHCSLVICLPQNRKILALAKACLSVCLHGYSHFVVKGSSFVIVIRLNRVSNVLPIFEWIVHIWFISSWGRWISVLRYLHLYRPETTFFLQALSSPDLLAVWTCSIGVYMCVHVRMCMQHRYVRACTCMLRTVTFRYVDCDYFWAVIIVMYV